VPVDVVSPVLVGRNEELARLRAAVARTAAGEPGIVLVGGEAGVGKSRLLTAALGDLDDVRVLTGGCIELGGAELPFVPLVEALRTLARTTSPSDLDDLLGPARRELARLLPELAPEGAAPPPATGSTAQLFELFLGVLGRLGDERPLILVTEDLHWADRSTLDLVAFLVRALQGVRVLLVLTYRSDEVDRHHPLRPLLSGWERLRGVERLHLKRFDRAEVHAQIAAIVGTEPDRRMVDLVFDRSEGNAFFVEELVRAVRGGTGEHDLPPSLRDLLLSRAEGLSGSARRLLRTAAVAGRWVPERLLAEVAAVPTGELYEGLREAVDASLLVVDESGRGYAFRHALTRDAVYQDLLPGERVALHTAYADALDHDPGLVGQDVSVAATLALHWYAAHDLPRALSASVRAGRQAMAAFAPAEARRHLERALEVWPNVSEPETWAGVDQVEVLRLAARAAFHSGDPERALPFMDQALELIDADADPERAAYVVDQRSWALRSLGQGSAGLESLRQTVAGFPPQPSLAQAVVLASLANGLMRVMDEEAPAVARRALDVARAVGAREQEATALITLGSALSYLNHPHEGEAALREGLRLAEETRDHEAALRAFVNLSDSLESRGRHEEAAQAARDGLALATRVGLSRSLGSYLTGNLIEPLVRLGEWAEAERLGREAISAGLAGIFAASLRELLGYLAACTGRYDEALMHLREARRVLGHTQEQQFAQALSFVEADVERARGDLAAAADRVARSLELTTPGSVRYAWPLLWLGSRIAADRSTRARDHREDLSGAQAGPDEDLTQYLRTPSPVSVAYAAMTAAERLRRDAVPAVPAWQEAVRAWRTATDVWPLAYSSYRLGEALCAEGNREAAAAPLREAARSATALGAQPLLDDVVALARRARVDLVDAVPTADVATAAVPFGLTDREREVLALVAAGRSNGQIATALFISPKTASVHVSNILAKLQVSGRVEAAGVAHRLGLAGDPG
jgi:DNA-binding CsgD family transcriptional regulator/tetratricopeptide (TPR) repeat protein